MRGSTVHLTPFSSIGLYRLCGSPFRTSPKRMPYNRPGGRAYRSGPFSHARIAKGLVDTLYVRVQIETGSSFAGGQNGRLVTHEHLEETIQRVRPHRG